MKVLYLDESGDHSLGKIEPQYPMFVLGGAIFDSDYADGHLTNELNSLKVDLFGDPNLVIHTADIARNKNGFERLKSDAPFRQQFYDRMNDFMQNLEYMVVACAIRKDEHFRKYGLWALDPYLLSLNVVVERFYFELRNSQGIIVAEKRGEPLDSQLLLAWSELMISGTSFISASNLKSCVTNLELRHKKDNIAGLQIADLVVSPIGRHVLGKTDKQDWEIVESKFRRNYAGEYLGHGLVVLPKK